eukprot:scaffold5945_cov85-Alexandrium_tamarense.AAC.2
MAFNAVGGDTSESETYCTTSMPSESPSTQPSSTKAPTGGATKAPTGGATKAPTGKTNKKGKTRKYLNH